MRIIAYLKKSKIALLLIVLLLIVQAFADLSLPRYTSDLVDVGIQQGGVEDATPSVMSESTFNYVCMLSSSDADEQLLLLLQPQIPRYNHTSQSDVRLELHHGRRHLL